MDTSKLQPILNKESILKTANARELRQAPQDVLERYTGYALTHIPLGDTTQQLANLRRVIVENKTCAVGTVVGPYGYGKTSTAVHLWNELRKQRILSVPPFEWRNLDELLDAVYHWIRFEFAQGPKTYVEPLERLYHSYRQRYAEEMSARLGTDVAQDLIDRGRLVLDIRAEDVVGFYGEACQLCEKAGYQGLAIFTDELQATLAHYKPSRDQFFADLFEIVKGVLGLAGHWALILTMDDDTEGYIARLRSDVLQRLQRSALHFRVETMYNRREYPAELWAAFQDRFAFNGGDIILGETLDSVGQIAARRDLGAGPRMVTNALSLAIKNYIQRSTSYTPLQFVDDFLTGQVLFDQRGKFTTSVRKALDNPDVRLSESNQRVVKLLAAFPIGCSEEILQRFELLAAFRGLPPLARKELVLQQSGGYILRYLAEKEEEPEQIEQRLVKEFVSRYAPGKVYAERAASGFMSQILMEPLFIGWKSEGHNQVRIGAIEYQAEFFRGSFDARYPDRLVAVLITAVPQSPPPQWQKPTGDADIELRFELNYGIAASEPSRLLVSPTKPGVAVFQLNVNTFSTEDAEKMLRALTEYYDTEQLTPLLALSLMDHLYRNRGDRPDDRNRVNMVIAPLRQYALTVLLNERLETTPQDFASNMVGTERIKDLFRQQCRQLYPDYHTLIATRNWRENLQQYNYALDKVIADDGLSVARGRRPWKASKEDIADAFRIPGRRLVNLEPLIDVLGDLIVKEEFSGRQSSSEVSLRFQLHPLEQDWLSQLEGSRERVKRDGAELAALPAEQLMRGAKQTGYTDAEILEVIRLLQTRRFIDYDPKKNLLIRTVDDVDDLRDAVAAQISALENLVNGLKALPDFESGRYPIMHLRTTLEAAKERDEIEAIKAEVRQHDSNLRAFASQRLAIVKEKLQKEQEGLLERIQQGVPAWLGREFAASPLKDPLEKQRSDVAAAYEAALDDIRQAREDSIKSAQQIVGSGPEPIVSISKNLSDLSRLSRRLNTRVQSFEDRKEDMDAWRRVSEATVQLNAMAQHAQQVYGNDELLIEVNQLWSALRAKFEAQPLAVLGMHNDAEAQIEARRRRVTEWLERRREDFEKRCQAYRKALARSGIEAELRILFDTEHPSNSYNALAETALQYAVAHLSALARRFNDQLQIVRYALQVQQLPLEDSETRVHLALEQAKLLDQQIAPEIAHDLNRWDKALLEPLSVLTQTERELATEIQRAVQPRPAEGTEINLLQLLAASSSGRQIDLRGLIIHLLDQGSETVDLGAIMTDLRSLFQKNQVSIHVGLLQQNR